jgi:hypothetical protein
MMTNRMYLIGQALAGLLANTDTEGAMQDIAADAVNLADAALAAAGEKESAFRDLYSVTINGVEYSTTNKALVDEIARLRAELARFTEPLTQAQAVAAWNLWRESGSLSSGVEGIQVRDAMIRKVRAGKGE